MPAAGPRRGHALAARLAAAIGCSHTDHTMFDLSIVASLDGERRRRGQVAAAGQRSWLLPCEVALPSRRPASGLPAFPLPIVYKSCVLAVIRPTARLDQQWGEGEGATLNINQPPALPLPLPQRLCCPAMPPQRGYCTLKQLQPQHRPAESCCWRHYHATAARSAARDAGACSAPPAPNGRFATGSIQTAFKLEAVASCCPQNSVPAFFWRCTMLSRRSAIPGGELTVRGGASPMASTIVWGALTWASRMLGTCSVVGYGVGVAPCMDPLVAVTNCVHGTAAPASRHFAAATKQAIATHKRSMALIYWALRVEATGLLTGHWCWLAGATVPSAFLLPAGACSARLLPRFLKCNWHICVACQGCYVGSKMKRVRT